MAIGEEKIKPISFRKLMQLEQIHPDTFESVAPAWSPASPPSTGRRAFGGHIYAQSVWAASKTVGRGFVVHNVTGHFLLPSEVTKPFVYHVQRVRDGKVYTLRKVEMYQDSGVSTGDKVPCFVSTVSFKRDEEKGKTVEFGHQDVPKDHLWKTYGAILKDKAPEEHDPAPGADTAWWEAKSEQQRREDTELFPGVEIRKVDMRAYNKDAISVHRGGTGSGPDPDRSAVASQWRELLFYRMRKEGPGDMDEMNLNLHACAHLYASDRNSLFLVQRALGFEQDMAQMGSLAHSVVFHGSSEDLRMVDSRDNDKWFVQEGWTSASGDNRGLHNSRLWDLEEGRIVAQTWQDGMVRILATEGEGSKL